MRTESFDLRTQRLVHPGCATLGRPFEIDLEVLGEPAMCILEIPWIRSADVVPDSN